VFEGREARGEERRARGERRGAKVEGEGEDKAEGEREGERQDLLGLSKDGRVLDNNKFGNKEKVTRRAFLVIEARRVIRKQRKSERTGGRKYI
jgi:hypothetical protein